MQKCLILPAVALIVASIAGCSKDVSNNGLTTSTTANDQSDAVVVSTYMPLTVGTWWNYNNQSSAGVTKASTLSVTNFKKTFNGKLYTGVRTVQEDVQDTTFYNQSGHDYYTYIAGGNTTMEICFLEDDLAVGKSWNKKAGVVQGETLKCYGKIKEKNITLTVNGKTYKNVIHTHVEVRKQVLLLGITLVEADYYIAQNVGVIKTVSKPTITGNGNTVTTSITNYAIK